MEKVKGALAWLMRFSSLPLYVFSLVIIIKHISMPTNLMDDAWFYQILEGKADVLSAWKEFLSFRYEYWSSRIAIEGLLIVLVRMPVLWKIVDSVAIIYVVFTVSQLINPEKSLTKNIIIALVPAVFPDVLYEAGHVATSLNYLIPFACALLAIAIMYKRFSGREVAKFEYILSIPLLSFACFSEIISALILLVCLGCGVWYIVERKRVPVFELICLTISIGMLAYHLTCPGNDARYEQELVSWLPIHSTLNLAEQIELGFSSMAQAMFLEENELVGIFCLALALALTLKSRRVVCLIFAWIPFAFSIIFSNLYSFFGKVPIIAALKNQMLSICADPHITLKAIALDAVIAFLLFCILFTLRIVIRDTKKYVAVFYILASGAATKMALGLTPTVWVSSGRATIFLYIAIAVSCAIVINYVVLEIRSLLRQRLLDKCENISI